MEYIKIFVFLNDKQYDQIIAANICESKWKKAQGTAFQYRVDPPRPEMHIQKHVAIALAKHIHSKDKQVSWNADKSRHDNKSFDTAFPGIEKAKAIAITALKLPPNSILEEIPKDKQPNIYIDLLLEEEFSEGEVHGSAIMLYIR